MRIFIAMLVSLSGCIGAGFQSEVDETTPTQTIEFRCSANKSEIEATEVERIRDSKYIISGEFCPVAPAELRTLFLVDFSLSMYNQKKDRGNDRVIEKDDGSKTCGRLDAARAITKRLLNSTDPLTVDMKVGAVPFSRDVEDGIPLVGIDEFSGSLTTENFCGGLEATNYKAAFDEAKLRLTGEKGTKIVYFVSDGLPTLGGGGKKESAPRHREAAIAAASDLRSVEKLTLNTVFLGNIYDEAAQDFDPQDFLKNMTGDDTRVKVVDSAENLVSGILDLESPPAALEKDSVKGQLIIDKERMPIKITRFEKGDGEGVWQFATDPFRSFPVGSKKATLVVTAVDADGETYRMAYPVNIIQSD